MELPLTEVLTRLMLAPDFRQTIQEGLASARAGQLTDGDAYFEELEKQENSGGDR